MKAEVPYIIIGHGTGTFLRNADGSMTYTVLMPKGHHLYTIANTVLVQERKSDV
jgi:hypothetical protein